MTSSSWLRSTWHEDSSQDSKPETNQSSVLIAWIGERGSHKTWCVTKIHHWILALNFDLTCEVCWKLEEELSGVPLNFFPSYFDNSSHESSALHAEKFASTPRTPRLISILFECGLLQILMPHQNARKVWCAYSPTLQKGGLEWILFLKLHFLQNNFASPVERCFCPPLVTSKSTHAATNNMIDQKWSLRISFFHCMAMVCVACSK